VPSPRAVVIHLVLLAALFGVAFAVGYVYQYDPERDVVELVVDRNADVGGESELTSGTVVGVEGGTVRIRTEFDLLELPLSEVALEGLVSVEDPTAIEAGATVNMGGDRTATERVITGIVFVDQGEAQP